MSDFGSLICSNIGTVFILILLTNQFICIFIPIYDWKIVNGNVRSLKRMLFFQKLKRTALSSFFNREERLIQNYLGYSNTYWARRRL